MFDQFYFLATLPQSFASYVFTLMSKVISSSRLEGFRSLSLLGSLYKLVAKLLVTRLRRVIDKLIPIISMLSSKEIIGWQCGGSKRGN